MNIKRSFAFVILICMLVLTSCMQQTMVIPIGKETDLQSFNIEVEDYENNAYTLQHAPNGVYVSSPAAAEIAVALGCARKIKSCSSACAEVSGVPSSAREKIINLPDADALKNLSIDTAIISSSQKEIASTLKSAGINVFVFKDEGGISVAESNIRLMGAVFYKSNMAEEIIQIMRNDIAVIRALAEKLLENKKVCIEAGTEKIQYAYGGDSLVSELLNIAGGENVFESSTGTTYFTVEDIQKLDPELIISFVSGEEFTAQSIREREGYKDIYACKNGQVYLYGDDLPAVRPAPSLTDALYEIAKIIGTIK